MFNRGKRIEDEVTLKFDASGGMVTLQRASSASSHYDFQLQPNSTMRFKTSVRNIQTFTSVYK